MPPRTRCIFVTDMDPAAVDDLVIELNADGVEAHGFAGSVTDKLLLRSIGKLGTRTSSMSTGRRQGSTGSTQIKQVFLSDVKVAGVHKMPFSRAIRTGDFVFVSGVSAVDNLGQALDGGIEAQTRYVLVQIKNTLKEAGCEMSDVVNTTCFLDDPRDFWNFNRIFAEFFPNDPPTRSTVKSTLMLEGKVEIEAVAYKPS